MNKTPTLRDLIIAARDSGLSYRQMEEKVAAAEAKRPTGMKLNRTTASQIARGVHGGDPEDGTIRAIALVAGVPESVAFAAAGQRIAGSPFRDELPDGVDQLEPNERRVALDLLRILVAQRRELNRHDQPQQQPIDSDREAPASRASSSEVEKKTIERLARVADAYGTRLDRRLGADWAFNFYTQMSAGHLDEATTREVQDLRNIIAHSEPMFDLDEQEQMLAQVFVMTAAAIATAGAQSQESFELAANDNSEVVWGPPGRATHIDDGTGERELDAAVPQAADINDHQSDYDLAQRTRDPRVRAGDPDAYDNQIGEGADPEGPEGGA
ncbi:hypothetical protein [Gordonia sp. (in: high G+C Gram-positive bacteria)]|uniref:hypothetical protein n=1 Tax=Gordonia sp. (in: high G+C Gram-positive bacteria) TaxID=84139 RepID=UPI003C73585C